MPPYDSNDPDSALSTAQTIPLHTRDTQRDTAASNSSPWANARSVPAPVNLAPASVSGQRYLSRRILGEGGMGEVHLSSDVWLGRDVAMKVLRPSGSGSDGTARFFREARLQGQLEHPSVVPVYDLGKDDGGPPHFTMKRVQGLTLREILDRLIAGDPKVEATFPIRKLLSAFTQVCLCVAYAHARGVIHRDLKPENVMLGEFGEVYVLDWGVARLSSADDPGAETVGSVIVADPPSSDVVATVAGSLVGTPGYMSPEQARGDNDKVAQPSDVYALGAILFELLTRDPLHRGRTVPELLVSALANPSVRPSSRAPDADIAPELDDLVLRATAETPEARLSARELGLALERWLDGARDVERRRELANEHLAKAREALTDAARGDHVRRGDALRELGRALALEPNDQALALLSEALILRSDELPAEAERELKAVELKDRALGARRAGYIYASWVGFIPIMLWVGVHDWTAWLISDVMVGLVGIHALWIGSTGRGAPQYMRRQILLNFLMVGATSTLVGPLLFLPGMAATLAAIFIVTLRANRWTQWLLAGSAILSFLVPLGLEWWGLVPRSYGLEGGKLVFYPRMLEMTPFRIEAFLVLAGILQVMITLFSVGRASDGLVKAERRNFAQAYRLRQLLPEGAGGLAEPPPSSQVCEPLLSARRS
ncbi:MAG: protein kinase [Polyangiaceae bacterium]|nr:protein kinase [Polyangiaceae bacterium]